jgi:hypothetical protein
MSTRPPSPGAFSNPVASDQYPAESSSEAQQEAAGQQDGRRLVVRQNAGRSARVSGTRKCRDRDRNGKHSDYENYTRLHFPTRYHLCTSPAWPLLRLQAQVQIDHGYKDLL